ncbi:MAG: hypothetical protein KDG52_01805 [Rhodocyclaceae bacterium]|nr:hypothetical protein [Rhodocyclaceae bacterium]
MFVRLALLLAIPLHCAAAPEPLSLRASLAWGGVARADAPNELRIELLSAVAGQAEIALDDHRPPLHVRVALAPDRGERVVVPVRPDPYRPLAVTVRIGDEPPRRLEIPVRPRADHAVVADVRARGPASAGIATIHPPLSALPETAAAYATIDALILDGEALDAMGGPRRAALGGHLAACGRVAAVAVDPALAAGLRANAGCAGRFLAIVSAPSELDAALAGLVARQAPSGPSTSALSALGASTPAAQDDPVLPVVAFAFVYLLAAPLLVRRTSSPLALLSIPLGATALAVVAWSGTPPRMSVTSWSEAYSGDRTARTFALMQFEGRGRTDALAPLPGAFGQPTIDADAGALALIYRDDRPGVAYLTAPTRLFSRQRLHLAPSSGSALPLTISLEGPVPTVRNHGSDPSPAALLGWRGRRYSVPPLPPGASWQAAAEAEAWHVDDAAERALRSASVVGPPALLLPFTPASMAELPEQVEHTGWLLIRPS